MLNFTGFTIVLGFCGEDFLVKQTIKNQKL